MKATAQSETLVNGQSHGDEVAQHRQGTQHSCSEIYRIYIQQAIPLALGGIFEEWQIQVIGFFAGALGGVSLAANNGLMNAFVTLSALNYGIMSATTVRVGFFLERTLRARLVR